MSDLVDLPTERHGPVTTRQLVVYAGASNDLNELHYDLGFAQAAGFPSVVVHGMLSMGVVGVYVARHCGGPQAILRLRARFSGVVLAGDTLTLNGRKTGSTVEVKVTRGDGTVVLVGEAEIRPVSG